MDQRQSLEQRVFFEIHRDLPREGPGNRDSARTALSLAANLPAAPRILDVACGPGAGTLDLAALLPSATIEAFDAHQPFVDQAQRRIADAGLTHRVNVSLGDMRSKPFAPASFDLIWCEGAAYIVGLSFALQSWLPLLRQGGSIAFTEAVWLRPDPPEALRQWWAENVGLMGDIAACEALVESEGYRLQGSFVLPEAAWWDDYYDPIERQIEALTSKYAGNDRALELIAEHQTEIDWYRRSSDCYGYLFVVATPR